MRTKVLWFVVFALLVGLFGTTSSVVNAQGSVQVVVKQDAAPLNVFKSADMKSEVLKSLDAGTQVTVIGTKGDFSYITSPTDGWVLTSGLETKSQQQNNVGNFPKPDYSWLSDPQNGKVASDAVVYNADKAMTKLGTLPAGTVMRAWKYIDPASGVNWFLIRSEKFSGWINGDKAQFAADPSVDLSGVNFLTDKCTIPKTTSESQPWAAPIIYAPNGLVVRDVSRTDCDMVFEGRFTSDRDDHIVFAVRENGKVSEFVHDGWLAYAEGSLWRYNPDWLMSWSDASEPIPGTKKLPIVGEFLVKKAKVFTGNPVNFDPPFVLFLMSGEAVSLKRDDLLKWPQAEAILKSQTCVLAELPVAGVYAGEDARSAAVGATGCQSLMVGLAPDTVDGKVLISFWTDQKQNIPYVVDHTKFYMFPTGTDQVALAKWFKENLGNVLKDAGLSDRTTAIMDNVPGFNPGQEVPVADLVK